MHEPALPESPLPGVQTIELAPDHVALLQRFFDANPAYFVAVDGEPPGPDEARDELASAPPADWPYERQWFIGFADTNGALVAMASVVADLLAAGVWHVGLFIVASARHGSGDAQALYRSLEAWMTARGAHWIRLGVVRGNTRAERFWESLGFEELRVREGIVMGRLTQAVRVMFKPVRGGTRERYLALVARDRRDAP